MQLSLNQKTYLVIGMDYNFKYFDSLLKARKMMPDGHFFSIHYYSIHTTWSGNQHELYRISHIDNKGGAKTLMRNQWKLLFIQDGKYGALEYPDDNEIAPWRAANGFRIESPNGEVKIKYFSMYFISEEGLAPLNALRYFEEISKYSSWIDYDIKIENEKLKKENKELKEELAKLKKGV